MTYLSMVRTDPSQITQILDSTFIQCESKEAVVNPAEKDTLQVQFKQYFEQCKQFMFGQINHTAAVDELKKTSESGKGVCAKTLSYGDVAWKCETCEKDPTCIICQNCFEKGDHKGHQVWLKRNVSGCCDCGDPDAWAEEGFCSKHKGYAASSEVLLDQLPPFIKKSTKFVFGNVCRQLKIQCLKLQRVYAINQKAKTTSDQKQEQQKRISIIFLLFEFMDWSVEASAAFIHFWTDELNESYIFDIKNDPQLRESIKVQYENDPQFDSMKAHNCCVRSYINQDDRDQFSSQITKLILDEDGKDSILLNQSTNKNNQSVFSEDNLKQVRALKGVCTCRVMDLTFQVNFILIKKCKSLQYELYFKMFQSFKFKQILGLAFGANFEIISTSKGSKENDIGSVGVQILTIDEISLMLVQDDNIRNVITNTFSKAIDKMIESNFNEIQVNILFHILYDLKYMTRNKTLKFLINNTNFIETMLQQISKTYFQDLQEFRTEHIMFDLSAYKENVYNFDLFIFKILKAYLKAVDYRDLSKNNKIMSTFIELFKEIHQKMPDKNIGFFAIPLHRAFSYYLNRLLMQNYMQESKPNIQPKDLLLNIFKRHISIPPGMNTWLYIQSLIEIIIQPAVKMWVFTHEVLSGKWVMSGVYLSHLAGLYYKIYEQYLLLILGLFQLLISVSPEPAKTIELISQAFNSDEWMQVLAAKLNNGGITFTMQHLEKEFEKFKPLFDIKKLRQMINWQLKFYIQMTVSETSILYPLLTNLSKKESLISPVQNDCDPQIEAFLRNEMRRAIVHSLLLNGGKCDFKLIKQQMPGEGLYTESQFFEDEVLEVAEQISDMAKSGAGKVQFKLKEDKYLSWLDPYYCLVPQSQSKIQEVLQNIYQEKHLLNEVLGDYNGCYTFSTPIPSIIVQSLSKSKPLLCFLSSLITVWANQLQSTSTFKLVDDQIGYSLLKLLFILISNARKNYNLLSDDHPLIKVLTANEMLLLMSLKVKSQQHQGTQIESACKEILNNVYQIDKARFKLVGEMLGLQTEVQEQQINQSEEAENSQIRQQAKVKLDKVKEAAKKKQEAILKQFQSKRQTFTERAGGQEKSELDTSILSSRSPLTRSSSSVLEDQEEENWDEMECSLCKEELFYSDSSYLQNPFGQFGYISTSKLLYHAYKQAIEPFSSAEMESQEEEKKEGESQQSTLFNPLDHHQKQNCLELTQGTGGTLIKCSHFAHHKCLINFLTASEKDQRKREMRRIVGVDFNTFQCPLCKHIANVLIPFNPLTHYYDLSRNFSDYNKYDLLQFQCDILSKIVKAQEQRKTDFLPVDIKKKPQEFLRSIERFVEHKIQLLDVKGIDEFLKKTHKSKTGDHRVNIHNRVGKEEYADILETTRNVLILIVEGGITVGNAAEQEMSEESIQSICLGLISNVLERAKGWQIMENDFSSIAIQVMFYATILQGCDDYQKLDKLLKVITSGIYQMFKLQTLLKAQFSQQTLKKECIEGKPRDLLQNLTDREKLLSSISLEGAQKDQLMEQFIIPSQLSFLRKLTAFKILTHTIHLKNAKLSCQNDFNSMFNKDFRSQELKQQDNQFINTLTHIFDDQEEFDLLSKYLGLKEDVADSNIIGQIEKDLMHGSFIDTSKNLTKVESNEDSIIPDQIQELVTYFQSEENQRQALEIYALYKIINVLNPQLVIDNEVQKVIIKEQIIQSEKHIKLQMPAYFRLLQPTLNFKLENLPQDFQSLVQTYYKRKCKNCDTQPKESAICLLCGDTLCYLQKCCSGNLPKMKVMEGELSFHARICEGGSSIFLCTTDGKIILIENGRSSQRPSPYVNKFGETFSKNSKKWDNYHLSIQQVPGVQGLNQYDEIRKLYSNFNLSNEIIKERSMSESVFRMNAV